MKWICIKDFPEDLFIIKEDAWKAGKIFDRWTIILEGLSFSIFPKNFNLNEYVISLAEWRDRQIDNILND